MDPISLKLVIVGDGVVGKTCILSTYAHNSFPTEYVPTIFDNTTLSIKIDQTIVNLSLWDTAGQQQYERLRPLAYPSADIFLIIFSVDSPASFVNAKKKWYKEVNQANTSAIKIFIGNKIDLRDSNNNQTFIEKQSARKVFQQQLNCKYFECSALTRIGIIDLFEGSVRQALNARRDLEATKQDGVGRKKGTSDVCCQLI